MGVYFNCEICSRQASEFDKIDGKYFCEKCKEEAMGIGINFLMTKKILEKGKGL